MPLCSFLERNRGEEESTMEEALENQRNPTWKLYYNPHYCDACTNKNSPLQEEHLNLHLPPHKPKPWIKTLFKPMAASELDNARTQIRELQAELEFERELRRKVESLNGALAKELSDEREAREETERLCKELSEQVSFTREEMDRVRREVEEERRMLRIAEVWREERVQMKLSEARLLMEERLLELSKRLKTEKESKAEEEVVDASKVLTFSGSSDSNSSSLGSTSQQSQQRREVENPHIKRGINGFVEFPKGIRVRGNTTVGSLKGQLGSKLECQKAQLRILLRHRNPGGLGLMGTRENLVM